MENSLVKVEPTVSERFISKVVEECKATASGRFDVTDNQRKIIQEYFHGIDAALMAAETRRSAQVESGFQNASPVPVTWANVNLNRLALDSVYYSRLGLSMQAPNTLYPIPYYNRKTNKYDVNFMLGYRGKGFIAKKFAMNPVKNIICELVYSNDRFEVVKKAGFDDDGDKYTFSISNPFDRGEVVGGFGFVQYEDSSMNRLYTMSLKEILKRKPKNASVEFWGGEKAVWKNGKKVGAEQVEGWYEEMLLKTVKRRVYGMVEIDPSKVNEDYEFVMNRERENQELEIQAEIEENAGTVEIAAPEAPSAAEEVVYGKVSDLEPDF